MARNDTIDLVFDKPDIVPWDAATVMVKALEDLLNKAFQRVIMNRGVVTKYAGSPPSFTIQLAIAGPVRGGSVILPLLPMLPEILQLAFNRADDGLPYFEYLSTLADLTSLFDFTLGLIAGRNGILAKADRKDAPTELSPAERAQGQFTDLNSDEARQWVDQLMVAAEKTNCGSVRLRYRDVLDFELVRPDRERSNIRLGIANPRISPRNTDTPLRFVRSTEPIRVKYGDDILPAFLSEVVPSAPDPAPIFLWQSASALPPIGEEMEAIGDYVSRTDLEPVEPVPEKFGRAAGVFLVKGARRAAFD